MSRIVGGPRRYAETTPSAAYADHQSEQAPYEAPVNSKFSTPQSGGTTASLDTSASSKFMATPTSEAKSATINKQLDTTKVPRPDILCETSIEPVEYDTSSSTPPPGSCTGFITKDMGNAGPRYIRSTHYKIPVEENYVKNTQIPIGMIIQPFADPSADEEGVALVEYPEIGPMRCNRCRAYVNPNWVFTQNGSIAVCNLCRMGNDVPKEYYCPLDAEGHRSDRYEKPELYKGVYEFVAPQDYHQRALVTPNIMICIEASSTSYLSGILHQVLSSLQSLLDYIPSPELTKICIMTYDTGLNFFRVPEDLTKEIIITHVNDIDTPCVPFPHKYLFLSLQNEKDKINYLIEKIIQHYESSERIQKGVHASCFGAALVDCCDTLLKEGGRVLTFTTQAPTAGLGKIKMRDDHKLYGTENEKTLYTPQSEDYAIWAKRALEKRVSVDIFCFSPEYFDLPTVSQISGMTGGQFHYYPSYKPAQDSEKVHYELARNLTRFTGTDAVMTIRTCQGINFSEYITATGKKVEPELELSTVSSDTIINAFFKHDDKLSEGFAAFQVAVLYTNPSGQRVIRVLNFKAPVSNDMITIFRNCDVEAVSQLLIKRCLVNLPQLTVVQVRKNILDTLINILYSYRYHCGGNSSHSQLILPESLKTLPIYFLSALKTVAVRTVNTTKPDERFYDFLKFVTLPVNVISNWLYIKVYPLHTIYSQEAHSPGDLIEGRVILGQNLAASRDKIDRDGIYLLDNGDTLFLYVMREADPGFFPHLFGVETYEEVAALTALPEYIESDYFTKVTAIIDQLRRNKNSSYQTVRIVTDKDPAEQLIHSFFIEDERFGESYGNFLGSVHKQINAKMS